MEEQNTEFKQAEPRKNGGAGKTILCIILVLIIVLCVCGFLYLKNYRKAEKFYARSIEKFSNTYNEELKGGVDLSNIKEESKLSFNVSAPMFESSYKDIIDLVNKLSLKFTTQMKNSDQIQLNLDALYGNENLINLLIQANTSEKTAYAKVDQAIDKYFSIPMEEEFFENFNNEFSKEGLEKIGKALSIASKEISSIVKEEYCTTSKEKINYQGKDVNAQKYTIRFTGKQFVNELSKVLDNLSKNEEFLNCFDSDVKEEIKTAIKEAVEESKNVSETNDTIEISVYAKGFLSDEVISLSVKITDETQKSSYILDINKKDEKTYEYTVGTLSSASTESTEMFSGEIVINENTDKKIDCEVSVKVAMIGSVKVRIETALSKDLNIVNINKDEAKNIEELTEEEYTQIMENLEKSKLYEIINELGLMDMFGSSDDENYEYDFNDEDYTFDFDDEDFVVNY